VRGYWIVGYLEEKRPGLLKDRFSQDWDASAAEREIALALGLQPESFWREIDGLVVDHYGAVD